ncbi:MAG TPA: GtrA family protein [Nocardioidaceae bacterium]|nr:GtrA family protein [Nocardioidaceae bacterium]
MSASHGWTAQAARFGLVGVGTLVLDFVTYRALLLLDTDISPAKAAGFVVGTTAAYLLNRSWTFRARGGRRAIVAFAALYATTLVVNVAVNKVGVVLLEGEPWRIEVAFLVAQAVTSTLNFFGMRYLVFPDGRKR